MVRQMGARLAVLLLTSIVLTTGSIAMTARHAGAAEECVLTPTGIECAYSGGSSGSPGSTLPPLDGNRYFGVLNHPEHGWCWYLAHYPPGLNASDPRFADYIAENMAKYPECPRTSAQPSGSVQGSAWEVFRSLPLPAPTPVVVPLVGIANLPTEVTVLAPHTVSDRTRLPDGRYLEVRSRVIAIAVDWGDGTPRELHGAVAGEPLLVAHGYRWKTCPASYRTSHPAGFTCHAFLSAYPIEVTYVWEGHHRTGFSWIHLGVLERSTVVAHDVDEVIGVAVST